MASFEDLYRLQQGGNNPLINVQQMQANMPNWLRAPAPPNNNTGATQLFANQMNQIGRAGREQQRLDIERQRARDLADIQMQTFQAQQAQNKAAREAREGLAGQEEWSPLQQAAIRAGFGGDVVKGAMSPGAQSKPYTTQAQIQADISAGYLTDEMGRKLMDKEMQGGDVSPADRFKMEGDLNKRFDKNAQAFKEISNAYTTIQTIPETAIGDVALATKIMKLLDPGSVVRESELGVALGATGILDRLMNLASKAKEGKFLSPDQRKEFKQLANSVYTSAQQEFNNVRGSYTDRALRYGLNPENVVYDYSSRAMPKVGETVQVQGVPIKRVGD